MLWGNSAYCVRIRGEDLSCYSSKIESVLCPYNHCLAKTSSTAIAERPRDARVTSIRKMAKWNF